MKKEMAKVIGIDYQITGERFQRRIEHKIYNLRSKEKIRKW